MTHKLILMLALSLVACSQGFRLKHKHARNAQVSVAQEGPEEKPLEEVWQEAEEAEEDSVADIIPVDVVDCGTSRHIGKVTGYAPKAIATGKTTKIKAHGELSTAVRGGTFDIVFKLNNFPWTKWTHSGDMCKPGKMTLRFAGVWVGSLRWAAVPCPLKAGKISVDVSVSLASFIPSGMTGSGGVEASLKAKTRGGKPLLCAKLSPTELQGVAANTEEVSGDEIDDDDKLEQADVAGRGGEQCLPTGAQCSRGRECCSGHCLIGAGFCFAAGGRSDSLAEEVTLEEVMQQSGDQIDEEDESEIEQATVAGSSGSECLSTGAQCSRGRECCSGHCLIGAGFCFPFGGRSDALAQEVVEGRGQDADESE